jgi:hypothetical protein
MAVALTALVVALGGTATAATVVITSSKQIKDGAVTGADVKNSSLTGADVKNRSLTAADFKGSIQGAKGDPGAQGAQGPKGDQGARGPAGAFNVADATGKVLGTMVSSISQPFMSFMTPEGAILTYDPNPVTPNYPMIVWGMPIYYQAGGCAGTGYVTPQWPQPLQTAIVLAAPPVPGSDVYVAQPGTPQAFTAASRRDGSGCAAVSTGVSGALPVKAAGTVPSVTKPLFYAPAG